MLYFKVGPSSIDFYKRVFLHATPVRIIVPRGKLWYCQYTEKEIWTVLFSWSQPVKITCLVFMETKWFQIVTENLKDVWVGSSRNFSNYLSCIFLYSWGVFKTVSTIKDGASCENSQRFSSTIQSFVKIKYVNYYCNTFHLRCLAGFWMSLFFWVDIWKFECAYSCLFQILGVFNQFQTTISLILKRNQLNTNQIDWFLYDRNHELKWIENWVKSLRNTW